MDTATPREEANGCPVLDFDHHALPRERRFEIWNELRDLGPIFRSTRYGGFWVVSRYEEAAAVLLDADTWSSARTPDGQGGQAIPPFSWARPNVPGEYDGEAHAKYRRGFATYFTPRKVAERREQIQAIVKDVFDALDGRAEIDAKREIAVLIPGRSILTIMGADPNDASWMGLVAQEILGGSDDPVRAAELQAELRKIEERMLAQVADRRAAPRDDILTAYATLRDETGELLGRDDLLSVLVNSFLFGGLLTAAEVIANAILVLGHDRGLRRSLMDDPSLMAGFVNDMVRYVTPAPTVGRTAARDTVLAGQPIAAGDRILVMLAAANFDPRSFAKPDVVDPLRPPSRHMAFGLGVHHCPGAPLARLEIELAVSELLRRMPDYKVTNPATLDGGVTDSRGRWLSLMIEPHPKG
jgi:cytochrome P450